MPDEVPTAQDIEDAVAADVEEGIANFSDGTNSVSVLDPEKRLAVAEKLRRNAAAANPGFGLRNTQLRSPGGGFR